MRHERPTAFALDFRKRHFHEAATARVRRARRSPATLREAVAAAETEAAAEVEADPARETRVVRGKTLLALCLAALILAVFNSGGLAKYARDLAEARAGRPMLAAEPAAGITGSLPADAAGPR
jgi:ferric-dicitrate binding protein FerR (iron transport regulator)